MQKLKQKAVCGCCGGEVESIVTKSMYIHDSGLDQRPEYEYQLLDIMKCPHCHYCSAELDKPVPEKIKKFVFSDEYRKMVREIGIDQNDCCIKAAAELAQVNEEKIYMYLKSCWYLEFQNKRDLADSMRKKAVAIMEEEIELYPPIELVIIYIDSIRQLKQFDKCEKTINEIDNLVTQRFAPDETIYKIFQYEKQLIEARDSAPHMISEISN